MFAGLLNEKIDIYENVVTRTAHGSAPVTPQLIYSTRAKVGHIGGSRSVINSEIQYPYTKNFVVRSYVPVTENCLIKYKNSYYVISSIDEDPSLSQKTIITQILQE